MDSPLGPAVRGAERLGQGYRNISPYLLQNYNTLPLYVDGDITLALTLPVAWKPPQSLTPSRSNMIAQVASLHTPSRGYRLPNKTDSAASPKSLSRRHKET